MKANRFDRLLTIWTAAGGILIGGFLLFTLLIGGSASLGYCEEGLCFVGNHGVYTQVSAAVYTVSRIWEVVFWISLPLTAFGGFLISHLRERAERRKHRLD